LRSSARHVFPTADRRKWGNIVARAAVTVLAALVAAIIIALNVKLIFFVL